MSTNYYPESPKNTPLKLTSLPLSYKFKAFLAILAIILFFLLYIVLVISLGFLVYHAFIYNIEHINTFAILLKVGAIGGSIMLLLFTLKFFLKLKNHKPENRIKLKKETQKKLWNFISKICKETGAPLPKNIFIDPDVNAYVAYSNVWLSLFLPIKKELTIGLGLTSCLNLSEFKAVISHEFGHFAQNSMKIGSYINSANTIIHDMIYSRDKWDDILDQWRSSDLRLSAAAWAITPVIWVIRQVLSLFYQFLNIMYSSLSREMEFNADKVAVSTSGSDAIISALWKLDAGFENWNSTLNNAFLASKKKVFVKNLYIHNNIAIARIKEEQELKLESLPKDERGGKKFFSNSEISKANMYESHPPNDKREENAKVPYVVCIEDKRSPWLLFNEDEGLQEKMTALIHEKYINKKPKMFSEKAIFEKFIIQEQQGKELAEEYLNTFQDRFIFIEEEKELLKKVDSIKNISIKNIVKLKEELVELMKPIKEIDLLLEKAVKISEGTIKESTFKFQEKEFNKKTLQEGFLFLMQEKEKIFNADFKDWDIRFCQTHLAIAKEKSKEDTLLKIYKQHSVISEIYKDIVAVKNTVFNELTELQEKTDLEQHTVTSFGNRVKDMHFKLNDSLNKIDTIDFIPLPNIDDVAEFKEAIIDNGAFDRKEGLIFENGEFNNIVNELEAAVMDCQRVEQKNIASILAFHKDLFTDNHKSEIKIIAN
ncbi:MAG: M48 family metalloprotease [Polaribacter sp.]|uniref:M48 family metallopeptidase n=1 Tax=Polaribacter sp. TaxID=1920175 RepID=UPI002F350BBE